MTKAVVYTAQKIRTMDPGRPIADAVAVKDGRILSIGTLKSMRPWLDQIPHEIDDQFADKVIFPGFIDPHTHFRVSGTLMALTYIGPIDQQGPTGVTKGVTSREAVLDILRNAVETGDPDKPVLAWGLDPAVQGGLLDRDTLDEISSTRPIWVMTYAPHVVIANSPMLDQIGVDNTTNIYGVEKYDDGRLNGQFIEFGATQLAI